jgi:hypothetical protein
MTGSRRTDPVKYSAGPFSEGREPLRLMSIAGLLCFFVLSSGACRRHRISKQTAVS